jgi:hypothetical protein
MAKPLEFLFHRAIDVVEQERIPYLVYGGLALPAWGDVITTQDVDLVVQVSDEDAARLIGAFRGAGFHVPEGAETLFTIDTWARASLGGRDVDIALGATTFDLQAIRRAVRVPIFGRTVPIAAAEDLILYKLTAHRYKDLGHVESIIARQGPRLDLAHLRKWAQWLAEATKKFEIPGTLERFLQERGL